jgi:hypothetical protein
VLLFAPLFYVQVEKIFSKRKKREAVKNADLNPSGDR